MPIVAIYGVNVKEHSRYKGCTIYKGEGNKWFAQFTNEKGWIETLENNALSDLKMDINYQVSQGRVKS